MIVGAKLSSSQTRVRLPASPPKIYQTLSQYSLLSVFTLMLSPSFMNNGTCMTRPVSRVAGLLPPEAVSPFTPGSTCVTFRLTFGGRFTLAGVPFTFWMSTVSPSTRKFVWSPRLSTGSSNCSKLSWSMKK